MFRRVCYKPDTCTSTQNRSVWHSALKSQTESQVQGLTVCCSDWHKVAWAPRMGFSRQRWLPNGAPPAAHSEWRVGTRVRRHCLCKGRAVPGLPSRTWTTFTCFTYWASSDASMGSKNPTVLKGRNKKHWKSLHPIKLAISQFCLRLAFSRQVNQLLTKDLVYTERCCRVGARGVPQIPCSNQCKAPERLHFMPTLLTHLTLAPHFQVFQAGWGLAVGQEPGTRVLTSAPWGEAGIWSPGAHSEGVQAGHPGPALVLPKRGRFTAPKRAGRTGCSLMFFLTKRSDCVWAEGKEEERF